MKEVKRVVLANLYVGQSTRGQAIATLQVRYDDPALNQTGLLTETIPVEANVLRLFQTAPNPQVQPHILALAKYRQTQLAEASCNKAIALGGDDAANGCETRCKWETEPQPFCKQARLQSGEDLTDADRKKTRIVSKTVLQE